MYKQGPRAQGYLSSMHFLVCRCRPEKALKHNVCLTFSSNALSAAVAFRASLSVHLSQASSMAFEPITEMYIRTYNNLSLLPFLWSNPLQTPIWRMSRLARARNRHPPLDIQSHQPLIELQREGVRSWMMYSSLGMCFVVWKARLIYQNYNGMIGKLKLQFAIPYCVWISKLWRDYANDIGLCCNKEQIEFRISTFG